MDLRPPSYLTATKYLPSLNNSVWERSPAVIDLSIDDQVELDKSQQLSIRRARLGVEILKRPSDSRTKYDLFQRLNAGGTPANPQELRNCIMIMISNAYFATVKMLADYAPFRTVLAASDDQIERQRHMEYASRFLVHTFVPYDGKRDVEDYIDDGIMQLAALNTLFEAENCFKQTFELLSAAFGDGALRRQDQGRPQGRVSLAAFECIAIGVAKNLDAILELPNPVLFIQDRVHSFWNDNDLSRFFAPGLRGTIRIQRTIPFGTAFFAP